VKESKYQLTARYYFSKRTLDESAVRAKILRFTGKEVKNTASDAVC
jgi:hypothetical protein